MSRSLLIIGIAVGVLLILCDTLLYLDWISFQNFLPRYYHDLYSIYIHDWVINFILTYFYLTIINTVIFILVLRWKRLTFQFIYFFTWTILFLFWVLLSSFYEVQNPNIKLVIISSLLITAIIGALILMFTNTHRRIRLFAITVFLSYSATTLTLLGLVDYMYLKFIDILVWIASIRMFLYELRHLEEDYEEIVDEGPTS